MADFDRILIVGGGIGGLSLATALHRQGYTPELVERSTAWPAVGAGINLPANGVRVLRALGLGEAVDRNAAVLRRWGFFDQQGELLCETDLEELWRDVGTLSGRYACQTAGGAANRCCRCTASTGCFAHNLDPG
jgi:2-polyprenyl-6-methoxyphenol hydroxylase-like FAD-dependent oxidoreductase